MKQNRLGLDQTVDVIVELLYIRSGVYNDFQRVNPSINRCVCVVEYKN